MFIFRDLCLLFQLGDALFDRHIRRRRGAEDGFLQADADQLAVFGLAVLAPVGERHIEQSLVGCFLFQGGLHIDVVNHPLLEFLLHLVANVLLETADDQPLVAEVVFGVVVRIANGGGVEHVHQAGEGFCLAVVGGGRQHDERIRAAR